jgi:hypothetical protein
MNHCLRVGDSQFVLDNLGKGGRRAVAVALAPDQGDGAVEAVGLIAFQVIDPGFMSHLADG